MTALNIFSLHKSKSKGDSEAGDCVAEDETEAWNLALALGVAMFQRMVEITIGQAIYQNEDGAIIYPYLPSIKIFCDWILCSGSSILHEDVFLESIR